ncbi:2Fe-2S iron-sulfur cluster-binding protein [Geothrix sp. 21YS21S-4]|uniref:2Fe-2S iron-sulfur cluster-binding protein n=1 Tax=Geothrix sp. 21YS21S-4 TaxID=3068889 RepID=UPI0027B9F946|nr:2Fe-2S iron-sulfur cluster-binding protein [Geothrix sp. 21YS21S-4]
MARTRRADRVVGGRGTLMARCLAASLPVASACSGRGACARCMVTVLEGATCLSAPRLRERRALARNLAEPDQRLSCQCRVADPGGSILVTTGYW